MDDAPGIDRSVGQCFTSAASHRFIQGGAASSSQKQEQRSTLPCATLCVPVVDINDGGRKFGVVQAVRGVGKVPGGFSEADEEALAVFVSSSAFVLKNWTMEVRAQVLGSWGNTMRDVGRNNGRWKGRHTPTHDPSTNDAPRRRLDGAPFQLKEPPPGVVWTRDNYQLPAEGELCLTFAVTPRVNRLEDVVGVAMQTEILKLMQARPALLGYWDPFQGAFKTRMRYAAC